MGIFNSAIFNNAVFNTSGSVAIDTHDGATADDMRRYQEALKRQANARTEFENQNLPSIRKARKKNVELAIHNIEVYKEPDQEDNLMLLLLLTD